MIWVVRRSQRVVRGRWRNKEMPARSFEQLVVWQRGHELVLSIYNVTKKFPREEIFSLTDQLRRAASSVTANIAEGFGKISTRDKLRFYNMAQGSLEETRNHLILAHDLHYITEEESRLLNDKARLVSIMLNRYCQALIRNTSR